MSDMTVSSSVSPEASEKIDAAVVKIAVVVVLGAIMSILDITVVNVAIPTFQTEFGVGEYTTVAWVVIAYTLALAGVIPLTGWAADRFGTKRLYIGALGLFTVGSVLCATAWNIETLIGFRVIQGMGGGMLMPLGMTIMTRAAGPHRMGRLMAILGVPMLLGPIAGPILGGWLLDNASWHWIFLVNLPVGLAAMLYALVVLPRDVAQPSEKLDVVGMLLLSPGLVLLLFGVSSIPGSDGMSDPRVWASMLVGGLSVIGFVVYSFKPENPLLDLRLFANYDLAIATVTMVVSVAAFFGGLLLIPTFFQQVGGETPMDAGLLLAPQGIGAMLSIPIAGILADKIPVGRIVPFGMVAICGGMFALTSISADTSNTHIMSALFVLGLGIGFVLMPLMTAALRTLRPREVARGSTLLNIAQQIASSAGVAIISAVLTNQQQLAKSVGLVDEGAPFATSMMVAFLMCVGALIVSLFLPKKREVVEFEESGEPVPVGLR